jgi:hypothetical protein
MMAGSEKDRGGSGGLVTNVDNVDLPANCRGKTRGGSGELDTRRPIYYMPTSLKVEDQEMARLSL